MRFILRSTKKEANAYISELIGMYSGLGFIMSVFNLHGVMYGIVKVGCDNKKALLLLSKKVQTVR